MTEAPPELTTVVLVRHGVTEYTTGRRFSGGLSGHNPPLSEEGRAQITLVAEWLAGIRERVPAVITSPVRRTRESADLLAEAWEIPVIEEPGFAEMEFGAWEGLTFEEVGEKHRDELLAWFESIDVRPGGTGESFRAVEERVRTARERLLDSYRGQTVVVVSHVTPIKTLVAHALEAPVTAQFRMQLTPGSVTVLSYRETDQPGPPAAVRLLNALPPPQPAFVDRGGW